MKKKKKKKRECIFFFMSKHKKNAKRILQHLTGFFSYKSLTGFPMEIWWCWKGRRGGGSVCRQIFAVVAVF